MSVKFHINNDHVVKEVYECGCVLHLEDCPSCYGTGIYTISYGKHDVKVSRFNASNLLKIIDPCGNYPDLCGSWEPEDIIRIQSNILAAMDHTPPSTQTRLKSLLTLVSTANTLNTAVLFC